MNAIEVHDLQKSFEGFSLNDVSFSVPQGTVMGFVGENGAGKSTTNQLCLGIIASGIGFVLRPAGCRSVSRYRMDAMILG
ncbi:ATP-binding cassette domain-containing protein [Lysinibacillus xylanilyticus]|uniref:ATP-binding cassette domain-containing protein n=1 Tax=Lysinibacillus xylanilyticus TaxID=582475 RepID=UPI00381BEA8D